MAPVRIAIVREADKVDKIVDVFVGEERMSCVTEAAIVYSADNTGELKLTVLLDTVEVMVVKFDDEEDGDQV